MTYQVQLIDEGEFSKIENEWTCLLENSESNTIFLTWEWLFTWWNYYKSDKKLFMITVRDLEGRLKGLAPLCIKKVNPYGIMPMRILTFLGTEEVCSEYLDFILCREKDKEILKVIFEFIRSKSALWDYCHISDLLESSSSLDRIKEILDSQSIEYRISDAAVCPYIALPDSYETYIQRLSSNMRYNLKRRTRNLEKRHSATFSIWNDSTTMEKAMESLFEIHRQRRDMVGQEGYFSNNVLRAFHKEIANLLYKKEYVRFYCLSINGDQVSVLYGFRYNNKFFYYQSGMQPTYEKESVGMVLMGHCIKDSIANGLLEFDFLRGPEPYKFKWTSTYRKTINLAFASGSVKGKTYIFAKSFLKRIKKIVKRRSLFS